MHFIKISWIEKKLGNFLKNNVYTYVTGNMDNSGILHNA
jgi:hypothetical protein